MMNENEELNLSVLCDGKNILPPRTPRSAKKNCNSSPRNNTEVGRVGAMEKINQDYDSPWKDILEAYFQEFMAFFFPLIENDLNWEKGYKFLDKEFQGIVKEAEMGRRYLDKLIQVWRKDNCET